MKIRLEYHEEGKESFSTVWDTDQNISPPCTRPGCNGHFSIFPLVYGHNPEQQGPIERVEPCSNGCGNLLTYRITPLTE